MRILILTILLALTGCTSVTPKDLKSPCVATENPDGSPAPCIRRGVNDHWLV